MDTSEPRIMSYSELGFVPSTTNLQQQQQQRQQQQQNQQQQQLQHHEQQQTVVPISTPQQQLGSSGNFVQQHQMTRTTTPQQLIRTGSPQQLIRTGSPQQLIRTGSPQQLIRTGSPQQMMRTGSPLLVESSKPNIQMSNTVLQPRTFATQHQYIAIGKQQQHIAEIVSSKSQIVTNSTVLASRHPSGSQQAHRGLHRI